MAFLHPVSPWQPLRFPFYEQQGSSIAALGALVFVGRSELGGDLLKLDQLWLWGRMGNVEQKLYTWQP